jgi:hypothetical protein
MKKKVSIALHLILLVASVNLSSCSKEQGCMDPNSTAYNSEAEEDDGSCRYEGSNVLWYNEAAATGLVNDGAVSLTFYVNGETVGSTAATQFWTGAPDCGSSSSVTVTKDLGTSTGASYTYSVVDQSGFVYWTGILNFSANTCAVLELTL